MRTDSLPIEQLPHVSQLFKDYLLHFDKVREFYPYPPFNPSTLSTSAASLNYPDNRRQRVADILEKQNKSWGGGEKTIANIARFRAGAHAIVTGQQVSLFGGPLFSFLKAISVAKLAAETTEGGGIAAVPIFWLATEDHDVAEVSSATLLTRSELRTLTVPSHSPENTPVSAVQFGEAANNDISAIVAEAGALLGDSEISDLLKQFYVPGANFGDAFAQVFTRLFADFGIIFLDPSDPELHSIAKPIYRASVERCNRLTSALLNRCKHLEEAGYHAQVKVTPASTLLFAQVDGVRTPVHHSHDAFTIGPETLSRDQLLGRIEVRPEDFSANVLMRPIVQDFLLPTLAYVGGPSEIAYFAQASVVYKDLLGKVTPILPRLSATLIEPHVAQKLERYKLSLSDVFPGLEQLRTLLAKHSLPASLSLQFKNAKSELAASLALLTASLQQLDPTLVDAAKHAQSKMIYQLETLESRSASAELRKHADIGRHAEQLVNSLYPHKDLQERGIAGIYFLARHGKPLLNELYQSAKTNCADHQIFYL